MCVWGGGGAKVLVEVGNGRGCDSSARRGGGAHTAWTNQYTPSLCQLGGPSPALVAPPAARHRVQDVCLFVGFVAGRQRMRGERSADANRRWELEEGTTMQLKGSGLDIAGCFSR